MMLDIKSVVDTAKEELNKERLDKAKLEVKAKLKQIEAAKLVVRNLDRELEVLLSEIGDRA